jgi:ubiquinone/menaquinone biosynthesis C-methylase UbiE
VNKFKIAKKRGDYYPQLVELLSKNIKNNFSIFEVGCSSGLTTLELSLKLNTIPTLLNIDIKELKIAVKNFKKYDVKGRFILGDIKFLPFQNNSFDFLHCDGVIEHFDKKDRKIILKEIIRVSKKAIISFPNSKNIRYRLIKILLRKFKKWTFDKWGFEENISVKDIVEELKQQNVSSIKINFLDLPKDKWHRFLFNKEVIVVISIN